jgi:hypothetical protein
MFLLHTFLQLWQYMLIILTWEFFINFSFFYRQLFYKFRKRILCFADFKRFIKYKFIRIIQYSTLLCFHCNRLVCLFYTQIDNCRVSIAGYLFVLLHASQVFRVSRKLTIKHFILFGITIVTAIIIVTCALFIHSIHKKIKSDIDQYKKCF